MCPAKYNKYSYHFENFELLYIGFSDKCFKFILRCIFIDLMNTINLLVIKEKNHANLYTVQNHNCIFLDLIVTNSLINIHNK